eukprot:scaffold181426_cov52-Cyclotella_meneghiniana.AAC.2
MWVANKSDFKEFVAETAEETKAVVTTVLPISRSVMIGGVVAPRLTNTSSQQHRCECPKKSPSPCHY